MASPAQHTLAMLSSELVKRQGSEDHLQGRACAELSAPAHLFAPSKWHQGLTGHNCCPNTSKSCSRVTSWLSHPKAAVLGPAFVMGQAANLCEPQKLVANGP
jgi:hypothetical protein